MADENQGAAGSGVNPYSYGSAPGGSTQSASMGPVRSTLSRVPLAASVITSVPVSMLSGAVGTAVGVMSLTRGLSAGFGLVCCALPLAPVVVYSVAKAAGNFTKNANMESVGVDQAKLLGAKKANRWGIYTNVALGALAAGTGILVGALSPSPAQSTFVLPTVDAKIQAPDSSAPTTPKIQPAAPTTVTAVAVPKTDAAPKAPVVDVPGFQVSKDARIAEVAIRCDRNKLTTYRMVTIGKDDDAKIMADVIVEKDLNNGTVTYRDATEVERLAGKTFMAAEQVVVLKRERYNQYVVYPAQNVAATVEQDGNNFKVTSIRAATDKDMSMVPKGRTFKPHLPDPVRGVYKEKQVIDKSALPDAAKAVGGFVIADGKVSAVTKQADGSFKATVPSEQDAYKALLLAHDAPVFDGKLVSGLSNMDNQQRALGLAAVRVRQAYQLQA